MQADIGKTFDPEADEFTLEKIVEYGFDQFAEKISDISGAATKEMAIEVGLNDINKAWEALEIDLTPYKDKGHFKVRYALLEPWLNYFNLSTEIDCFSSRSCT